MLNKMFRKFANKSK